MKMTKYAIAALCILALISSTPAADNSLRVAQVHETITENILTNVALPDLRRPFVQSNGYRRMTFCLGTRIGGKTVSSIDLITHTVEMSDGTNTLRLVVIPGIQTNRVADLASLSNSTIQRVAVGDRLRDGTIISEIAPDGTVIAESATSGRLLIPSLTDSEREKLKKLKPQRSAGPHDSPVAGSPSGQP